MSKPDNIVSLADGSLNQSLQSPDNPASVSERKYADAHLFLMAMEALPDAGDPVEEPRTSNLNPIRPLTTSSSTVTAQTELDLAACLVALSKSPSPIPSSQTSAPLPLLPAPVVSPTAAPPTQPEPPTKNQSLRKTRISKKKRWREKSGDKEEEGSRKAAKRSQEEPPEPSWEARLQELQEAKTKLSTREFKAKFSSSSKVRGKWRGVAQWLQDQRLKFRNFGLSAQQLDSLRSLGCTGFECYDKGPGKREFEALVQPDWKQLATTPEGKPNIKAPNVNDVVFGRGAAIYKLPGNVQFRSLCSDRKMEYIAMKDYQKMPIAVEVISLIRGMNPPGRFIAKHANGKWYDVGDKIALKKTAMTLRQDAPAIREADTLAAVGISDNKADGGAKRRNYSWAERYAQIVRYKAKFGRANDPQQSKNQPEEIQRLAKWLSDQRKKHRKGLLVEEKRNKLCSIGCVGFEKEDADSDEETTGADITEAVSSGCRTMAKTKMSPGIGCAGFEEEEKQREAKDAWTSGDASEDQQQSSTVALSTRRQTRCWTEL